MANSLSVHKVPFELHIYPKGPHGLALAKAKREAEMLRLKADEETQPDKVSGGIDRNEEQPKQDGTDYDAVPNKASTYAERTEQIKQKIAALNAEYDNVSGFFKMGKQNKILNQIDVLEEELTTLERIVEIEKRIPVLEEDAASCHGLFGAVRRKKINNEIEALEEELDSLKESLDG